MIAIITTAGYKRLFTKVRVMHVSIQQRDCSLTKVEIQGRLDAVTAPEFETAFQELTKQDKIVLIDTSKLDYISSAGLRVFLALTKQSKQMDRTLVIHSLQEAVLRVFQVSGFEKILTLCATESEAQELIDKVKA